MQSELDGVAWEEQVRPDAFLSEAGTLEDTEEEQEESGDGLGAVAKALLVSVTEEPFLSLSERYDAIDVGKKTGSAAKDELVALDLIKKPVEVRTGKRGRNPKMLELTGKGRSVLEDHGYDVEEVGRRGIEDRYWQREIRQYYEAAGFEVEEEFSIGKQSIDVYATEGGRAIAIEVARSPEHELANIEKCLDYDVDRVEVVYLDEDVKRQVEAHVRDAFDGVPDQVKFVRALEYT